MAELLQFPASAVKRRNVPITPIPVNEAVDEEVGKIRIKWMRKAAKDLGDNRCNPEYEIILIWAVEDFLRWLER